MSLAEKERQIIGTRLRLAREMAGLSQAQAAKLMNVHRPTISEIEAGRRRVSVEELKLFAKIYRAAIGWLAGNRPESADPKEDRIQLAARELKKLRPADLDRVMRLLGALREDRE
jgi:transcriptional regulator with XRE-family HTH domain